MHQLLNRFVRISLVVASLLTPIGAFGAEADSGISRYLYVVTPGIRDYLEFGGAGILVFDIDRGHKFVRRIETPAMLWEIGNSSTVASVAEPPGPCHPPGESSMSKMKSSSVSSRLRGGAVSID